MLEYHKSQRIHKILSTITSQPGQSTTEARVTHIFFFVFLKTSLSEFGTLGLVFRKEQGLELDEEYHPHPDVDARVRTSLNKIKGRSVMVCVCAPAPT